ncbi:MAG: DUF924 domain-containing protein [Gammaproteobacteria bacterium]|nr:DUF924 domain-containing protein [Gammaproteobacteria bacterium]
MTEFAAQTILDFWFHPDNHSVWFQSTPDDDTRIREQFLRVYEAASRGELDNWQNTPQGALALCIIFDQFPLNMFRDQARSFATEARARAVATEAIHQGFDHDMDKEQLLFLYLPFMHSEDLADQDRVIELFTAAGLETRWAEHHRQIVQRFGRFPHRNAALGRQCTEEEEAWLNSDDAFHG